MGSLNFNYKDIFRSLRLGFSAKKVGMAMVGLLFAFAGYGILAYVAHLTAGNDWLSVWEIFRLLPFPRPDLPFPWFSWLIYSLGVVWFVLVMLVTAAAIAKVTFEQLRGNEFFEAGEGFKFALKNTGSLLGSPLLIIAFIALIVIAGLILSAIGAIPHFGTIFTALLAIIGFFASLFILYLLIVLFFTLLYSPAIVGTMGNDTFDTMFEVFSCINEQPARFVWYTIITAILARFGSFLLGIAANLSTRIGSLILGTFMGEKWQEMLAGAESIFKIVIPRWGVFTPLHEAFLWEARIYGIPNIYIPTPWFNPVWSITIGSILLAACGYAIALIVIGYGLSVWISGTTVALTIIIKKKDDKNILEVPEEEEEEIFEPEQRQEQETK